MAPARRGVGKALASILALAFCDGVALSAAAIAGHQTVGDAPELVPKYALVGEHKVETMWQRPHGEPKGIFFMAHGCNHQGTDFFSDVGPDGHVIQECANSQFGRCLGLPEEVRLRQTARSRGYVAMSVSGGTGVRSCWDMRGDAAKVREAVDFVRQAEGLDENAPVIATGASSGGAFMGTLAAPLNLGGLPKLRCIVPQIMALGGGPHRGIPTLFVHMPRDQRTAMRVQFNMEELQADGVRVQELHVDPLPVTPEFLQPCLGAELAQAAFQSLRHVSGLMDANGFLEGDARARRWVSPLRKVLSGKTNDTLVADESCLAELMNVAWAFHEMTSQFADKMLDFCEEAITSGAGPQDDEEVWAQMRQVLSEKGKMHDL